MPKKINGFTARAVYCPVCPTPQRLVRVNLNQVFARKGCFNCRRKFDYFRTDTPEGRAARVREWQLTHGFVASPRVPLPSVDQFAPLKPQPKTNAERQAKYRQAKREAQKQ